eukprot:TRINITY_DN1739_c0_g1_i1.p1 TRINITY_DN1739_c0_g1~~TRINITY_DN1739_c0_g1_i1.p1  ORF type:complete len:408 (-),score=49.18 TRINITY_DN1739_c0_g1_i1:309-1532(-)
MQSKMIYLFFLFLLGTSTATESVSQGGAGVNKLALSLWPEICKEGNCVFSPFSIFQALGLVFVGAAGNTAAQIQSVIGLDSLTGEEIDDIYLNLITSFQSSSNDSDLFLANRFYGAKHTQFLESFLQTLNEFYSSDAISMDFSDSEKSRMQINKWVEEMTEEMIQNLLPPGSIGSSTVAVLVNALYFQGAWENQFMSDLTEKLPFATLSGEVKEVDTMVQIGIEQTVGSLFDGQASFVQLPYLGRDASMYIVVPKPLRRWQFTDSNSQALNIWQILQQFNETTFQEMFEGGVEEDMWELQLPKFTLEFEVKLSGPLSQVGMPDAFNSLLADFSGMVGYKGLYIDEGFHKTKVIVDEVGTEAASATAFSSFESLPSYFKVDQPFAFFIVHEESKSILFTGIVDDPSET